MHLLKSYQFLQLCKLQLNKPLESKLDLYLSHPNPLTSFTIIQLTCIFLYFQGYDKLKPYGFPIHGCICGYSRRILWLELVTSNNDPNITARLYLDSVQKLKGCPRVVRSDCGTENCLIAAMQYFLEHMIMMNFRGLRLIVMVLHLLTREQRVGGLVLEEVDRIGGQTFLKIWCSQESLCLVTFFK